MGDLAQVLQLFVQVLIFAIFARAILSWFPVDRGGPLVRALDAVTEPILSPLRRVIPLVGMVDITPMVAIIVLIVISQALSGSS
jgi:YggT family protein